MPSRTPFYFVDDRVDTIATHRSIVRLADNGLDDKQSVHAPVIGVIFIPQLDSLVVRCFASDTLPPRTYTKYELTPQIKACMLLVDLAWVMWP